MKKRPSPPRARKATTTPELPSRGDEEPTARWTLRLLYHSSAYRRLPPYSEDLDAVLETIGLKASQGDKPKPEEAARHIVKKLKEPQRKGEDFEVQTLRKNVSMLAALLGLTEAEQQILTFVALATNRTPLRACLRGIEKTSPRSLATLLARVLDLPEPSINKALDPRSTLRALRLITIDRHFLSDESPLHLLSNLDEQFFEEHEHVNDLLRGFARVAGPPRLTAADYPHLALDLRLLERLLRAAIERKEVGVNVLLYGPSGTGKTELTRVIAAALGATLHEGQLEGNDGKALGAHDRLASYQLCQRLAAHSRPSLVLFDEIEDIFRNPADEIFDEQSGAGRDKGYLTRMLEENPVPALWVSNRIEQIDVALLRRFDLVLEVPTPPEQVRRTVLQRFTDGLGIKPEWLDRMATDEALTPAHAERAARVARFVQPADSEATDVLDRVLRGSLSVTRTRAAPSTRQATLSYDIAYLKTDSALEPIVEAIARQPSASLCFYGPPGTGKTAFVWHLARSLQKPLQVRRASELLGSYVGQTEANLAEMFRRASIDRAVLFLDEADSFLQRRDGADRQWEITQVNELLTQMETFDGVFICATNRIEHLDPASLRRFDIRVRFDYLDRDQRLALFTRALAELNAPATPPPPGPSARATLDRLANLTPGDFATVVRRGRLLGSPRDEVSLLSALEGECRSKTDGSRLPLGFLRQ